MHSNRYLCITNSKYLLIHYDAEYTLHQGLTDQIINLIRRYSDGKESWNRTNFN